MEMRGSNAHRVNGLTRRAQRSSGNRPLASCLKEREEEGVLNHIICIIYDARIRINLEEFASRSILNIYIM